MKKIILFMLLLIFPLFCFSQIRDSLIIREYSLCNCVENSSEIFSVLYEINNNTCDVFYLWIEKEIHSPELERINDYFKKNKGDASLYQMAMEVNISYECPSLFTTFLKKIKPQETFIIQIISTGIMSECEKKQIYTYLDTHVVIMNENILTKYIEGLSNFNPLLFYKNDFITLPVEMINF
ncbi:MAG: hypothetical protein FWF52_07340 [Candidatus Azobacteroides sp.]|nr:hypothetical protein [Candidatus Azobacteroides sp.]